MPLCPCAPEPLSPCAPVPLQILEEGSAMVAAIENKAWQEQMDKALEGSRNLASRWVKLRGGAS